MTQSLLLNHADTEGKMMWWQCKPKKEKKERKKEVQKQ